LSIDHIKTIVQSDDHTPIIQIDPWFVWKPNDSLRYHTTTRTTQLVTIEEECAWRQNLVRLAYVVTVVGSSSS
jgi:hypothetical protein